MSASLKSSEIFWPVYSCGPRVGGGQVGLAGGGYRRPRRRLRGRPDGQRVRGRLAGGEGVEVRVGRRAIGTARARRRIVHAREALGDRMHPRLLGDDLDVVSRLGGDRVRRDDLDLGRRIGRRRRRRRDRIGGGRRRPFANRTPTTGPPRSIAVSSRRRIAGDGRARRRLPAPRILDCRRRGRRPPAHRSPGRRRPRSRGCGRPRRRPRSRPRSGATWPQTDVALVRRAVEHLVNAAGEARTEQRRDRALAALDDVVPW